MNKSDVIRAWKDPLYRASLSDEERAALPDHPAGFVEIDEGQLKLAGGGTSTTAPTCTAYTFLNWRACCPPITTAPNCTAYTFSGLHGCCPATAT